MLSENCDPSMYATTLTGDPPARSYSMRCSPLAYRDLEGVEERILHDEPIFFAPELHIGSGETRRDRVEIPARRDDQRPGAQARGSFRLRGRLRAVPDIDGQRMRHVAGLQREV